MNFEQNPPHSDASSQSATHSTQELDITAVGIASNAALMR